MRRIKNDKAVQRVWDFSHKMGSPIFNLRRNLIINLIPAEGRKKICLDVGCGTGEYTLELLKRGFVVHSLDDSRYAMQILADGIAKDYKRKFYGFTQSFEKYRTRTKYDLILVSEVLEHIKNDDLALKKVSSLLKRDGRVVISVPSDMSLWSESDIFSGHYRRYSYTQMRNLITHSRLDIEKFYCYGFPILRLYAWANKVFIGRRIIDGIESAYKNRFIRLFHKILFIVFDCLLFLDRRLVHTPWGIGFVIRAKKKSI